MRFISWSLDGVKEGTSTELNNLITTNNPDVVFLQCAKITEEDLAQPGKVFSKLAVVHLDYEEYDLVSNVPGVGGVITLVKNSLLGEYEDNYGDYSSSITDNTQVVEMEGRLQALAFIGLKAFNYHAPIPINEEREKVRIAYDNHLAGLYPQLRDIDKNEPTLIFGNFGILSSELDHHTGSIPEDLACSDKNSRERLAKFEKSEKLVDVYRYLNPDKAEYDFFSKRGYTLESNLGMRLSRIYIQEDFADLVRSIEILKNVTSSTNLPIVVDIDI